MAGGGDGQSPAEAVAAGHHDAAHGLILQMLLHLHSVARAVCLHGQRLIDGGQAPLREAYVDHGAGNARDLLSDGGLTRPVVLHGQILQQLLRILIRRVHGGHAGTLLTAEAVHQRAVNKAGEAAAHRVVQHGGGVGDELERGASGSVRLGGGKPLPVQGQQLGLTHRGLQSVFHVCVNDVYGIDLAGIVPLQQQLADLAGTLQRGVLGGIEKALFDGDAPLAEPAAAILAHHIQHRALVGGQKLLGLPDGVLVIGAGKALVRRDQQAGGHAGQRSGVGVLRHEIAALNAAVGVEHAADLRLQSVEVGAGIAEILLGLAQLGLRDEVHGVGDLLGLPDASDAAADLTCAGHGLTARLCAGTSPARSLQSPRSGRAPRRSAPRPAPAPA